MWILLCIQIHQPTTFSQYCCFSWWRHQKKTFSASLAICWRNSPVTGEFPAQMDSNAELWGFLFICVWINGWVNNRETGDLIRHRAHCDATAMMAKLSLIVRMQIKLTLSIHIHSLDSGCFFIMAYNHHNHHSLCDCHFIDHMGSHVMYVVRVLIIFQKNVFN